MKFQIPKGLFDILPYETKEPWRHSDNWQYVETMIRKISRVFGFREIRTPVFERAELFNRGIGATSDIVSKEMYLFKDKAERLLALRPEGTSSVMRAFAEKNLQNLAKIHKLFYIAPMFRYERPQAGRYRQHHQFGVEAIGNEHPEQDAEVIDMLWQFFKKLGLKNLELHLNSIGDAECRSNYKTALKGYLQPHINDLSKESQARFEKNILRILDSKDEKDKAIIENAPSILDFLTGEAKVHFYKLCQLLDQIKIPYTLNPKIVRGLDYYNRTVFEVLASGLGAQNAIGAGGRFDGFTKEFGIQPLPAVGFGSGIERVIQTMLEQQISFPSLNHPFIFIIPLDALSANFAFPLMSSLRMNNIPTEMDYDVKKISNSLQKANQLNAKFILVIGSDEMASKIVKLKNMQERTEESVPLEQLDEKLKSYWKKYESK